MNIKTNYFNRYLFILIPLVAILIVGVYLISYGVKDPGTSLQYHRSWNCNDLPDYGLDACQL